MKQIQHKSFQRLRLRQLDAILRSFQVLKNAPIPTRGWLSEIRRAIGMRTSQLGLRMGLTKQRVGALERAEREGKLTINSLRRAADALECDLVYALVPRDGLEALVDRQARAMAAAIVRHASHSMSLELQGIGDQELDAQERELADRLKSELPSNLWNRAADESGSAGWEHPTRPGRV